MVNFNFTVMNKFIVLCALIFVGCSPAAFKPKWVKEKAPAGFIARFETSKGNFDVQITRVQSPLAADRFYQLVKHGYFNNVLFYRVVPGFVAQFGNTDTTITKKWEKYKIPDEPVTVSNKKGTLSFARAGKETRSGDLFINLADNPRLDTLGYEGVKGFPVFGKVTRGMEVVEAMYGGYGDKTMAVYDSLSAGRRQYQAMFPLLDSIKKAYLFR